MQNNTAALAWVAGVICSAILLATLAAWFYLGTDILLVYLEQGLSYCF